MAHFNEKSVFLPFLSVYRPFIFVNKTTIPARSRDNLHFSSDLNYPSETHRRKNFTSLLISRSSRSKSDKPALPRVQLHRNSSSGRSSAILQRQYRGAGSRKESLGGTISRQRVSREPIDRVYFRQATP